MNVTSIRIVEHNLSLEKVIQAVTALDNIVSNNITWPEHMIPDSSAYGSRLGVLFRYVLYGKKEKQWNQYVFDTFHCFAKSKTRLNISLWRLSMYVKDQVLLNLLFHKFGRNYKGVMDEQNLTNLIKPEFFKIFDNVESIILHCYNGYGFSLFGFLSLIAKTKINEATIIFNVGESGLSRSDKKGIAEKSSASGFKVDLVFGGWMNIKINRL